MKLAELQLKDYIFTEVVVKANPKYAHSSTTELNCSLDDLLFDVDVLVHQENEHKFAVQLGLRTASSSSKKRAYELSVNAFGQFEVAKTLNSSEAFAYVTRSGSSILYGAIRELVVSITARGPWGGHYLPAVDANFFGEVQNNTIAAAGDLTEGSNVERKARAKKKSA